MLTQEQADKINKLNAPLLAMLAEYVECEGGRSEFKRAKSAADKLRRYIASLVEEVK